MPRTDPTPPSCIQSRPAQLARPHIVVRDCSTVSLASQTHRLIGDEVHIWCANLSATGFDEQAFCKLLSTDEIGRMQRFHFQGDRRNFLFCRGMLRILLASYLGASPAELLFAYSAHGKPSLATLPGSVEFNLSHSNRNLLIAISQRRKIGVDIEFVRCELDVQEIAGRFFSREETRALMQLPTSLRYDAFFSCWTRKEAFVKARGEGLSWPLNSFDVSVMPDEDEVALVTRPDHSEAERWSLRSLNCFSGYRAAVAFNSPRGRRHSRQR